MKDSFGPRGSRPTASTLPILNAASTSLWLLRVEVSYTEDGGSAGANGGALDHTMAAELIRTVEEAL